MADRFYVDGPIGLGPITLEGPEAHHLANVRRFEVGERVTLFNGDGHEYLADIRELGRKKVSLEVVGVESPDRELRHRLHIAAAMPKGDRGDFLIEKLTELGATDFTPLETERSIVRIDGAKVEKLRRAVIEASKQCGRNVLMRIHPAAKWLDWCRTTTGERWIAHPGGDASSEISVGDATLAIGPEGGFTDDEVSAALAIGWRPLNLGPRILRVETAALAAAVRFG